MAISNDPSNLDALLKDVTELFQNNNKYVNPRIPENKSSQPNVHQTQAPIKANFYNSGAFSYQATDARHPKGHMGVDMRAPAGTPIYPFAPGIVTNVGSSSIGGNIVNIQHANNLRSYYAHCGTVKVHKGDKVDNNTIIATVGDSGNAKGTMPHLHFQVWENNQIQNPEKYFTMPKYTNFDKNSEKFWMSEEAKAEALKFNMKNHIANNRLAFSLEVRKLIKLADAYYNISQKILL